VARNRARYLLLSVKPLASSNMCTTENVKVNSKDVLKHQAVATPRILSKLSPCLPGKAWGKAGKRGKGKCGVVNRLPN
jgi:hypothetical protein